MNNIPKHLLEIKTPQDSKTLVASLGKTPISYSQLTNFLNCQYAWKLDYLDKVRLKSPSIHLIFGTAMHTTLQTFLTKMFETSAVEAEELKLDKILLEEMKKEYEKEVINSGKHFSTKFELLEFYNDGMEIINFFIKHRNEYFSKKQCKLIGVEVPLIVECDSNPSIMITGFIDIVLYDEVLNKYKIIDIKTSTKGWNKYQKADTHKLAQLLIYKKYFAKQFKVPIENVDVEYFIVKRKLYENVEFPQKRIQLFTPASGKTSINRTEKDLDSFVNVVFDKNGSVNPNMIFKKSLNKACNWCPYKHTTYCPESK